MALQYLSKFDIDPSVIFSMPKFKNKKNIFTQKKKKRLPLYLFSFSFSFISFKSRNTK